MRAKLPLQKILMKIVLSLSLISLHGCGTWLGNPLEPKPDSDSQKAALLFLEKLMKYV